ncbi:hypothetical protein TNCV_2448311 [Trichonephila clavipes]|uniref:Uncharacterized protein n=1 Tax=Trichonephila clavipes TaxID=2585209 RepID=A0A8X6SJK8_TRICX|nr:hypothetical protein TNCV_2448311 [Trichonephila clavipes]
MVIPVNYYQAFEFEIDRIMELKEASCAKRRIFRHMDRSDAAIRRCCDESRFQLCTDIHRKRAWRGPGQRVHLDFIIASHTGPQPGSMVSGYTCQTLPCPASQITSSLSNRAYLGYDGKTTPYIR